MTTLPVHLLLFRSFALVAPPPALLLLLQWPVFGPLAPEAMVNDRRGDGDDDRRRRRHGCADGIRAVRSPQCPRTFPRRS